MKMYESYDASRDHCNKYLECQDNALVSYFLPHEYYREDGHGPAHVDYMKEFQGHFNCVDSTATSKQLIFKTDPDEDADEWRRKEQKDWTSGDVLHWIASVAESQQFPYECINANAFNVDGKTLLSLTKRDFVQSDDKYGLILYNALHKAWEGPRPALAYPPRPYEDPAPAPYKPETVCKSEIRLETLSTPANPSANLISYAGKNSRTGPLYGLVSGPNDLADSSESYPFELNPGNRKPEAEPEPGACSEPGKNSPEVSSEGEQSDGETGNRKQRKVPGGKRLPGRPPGVRGKKEKAEKKTGRLWEFIRDLLLDPQHCPSVICWENHDDGVFRFVKSEKVAKIWGDRKGNEKMNYEKLSRAMRYYYRSKVLQPVIGRRLVYKFGPTARGWKTENPNFRH